MPVSLPRAGSRCAASTQEAACLSPPGYRLLHYAPISTDATTRITTRQRRNTVATAYSAELEKSTYGKVAWHLIPFLFLCYIVAFLDRVNVGFAKLQMAPDLKFSDAVYGF